MEKTWYPQRNESDATIALLKNFIHYLNFPVSKYTIEKDVQEHVDFPANISLATLMMLLEKWTIKHKAFKCPLENLKDIASPSILFMSDTEGSKAGYFVLFHEVKNEIVEYLDTRKGWVIEEISEFAKKFGNVAISAQAIEISETNFELREKEYQEKKSANTDLKNVQIIDDFLTDAECDYIINLSTPLFERSMYLFGDEKIVHKDRTSYSAELHVFPTDEILNTIRRRASELIKLPESHFEFFQCLSYDKTQEINSHYDTFDENTEGGRKIIENGGQRKYTILAYLNDEFTGGGTYFPNLDFMVMPKKRRIVIFKNIDESGKVMDIAFHAGLPVTIGRKYAMNIWVRSKALL